MGASVGRSRNSAGKGLWEGLVPWIQLATILAGFCASDAQLAGFRCVQTFSMKYPQLLKLLELGAATALLRLELCTHQ